GCPGARRGSLRSAVPARCPARRRSCRRWAARPALPIRADGPAGPWPGRPASGRWPAAAPGEWRRGDRRGCARSCQCSLQMNARSSRPGAASRRPAELSKGPPALHRVEWAARSIVPAVLNPPQRAAVLHDQGPLLVLAGAGSGKTRVIVEKIAHLIASGRYPARRIAAITFTNKSAKEMRERVAKRIRGDAADGLTICTFHALGLKFLQI